MNRRSLATGAATLVIFGGFGAAPALAAPSGGDDVTVTQGSGKPKPVPPSSAPGLGRTGVDRPDEANTPRTGPTNRDHSL